MTDRELLAQALEALEEISGGYSQNLIVALRKRLAQPEQEPNYWLGYGLQAHTEKPFEGATPLYTAPPQRKPLTDEEISNIWCKVSNTDFVTADTHEFARAIEAAHGIKGEA